MTIAKPSFRLSLNQHPCFDLEAVNHHKLVLKGRSDFDIQYLIISFNLVPSYQLDTNSSFDPLSFGRFRFFQLWICSLRCIFQRNCVVPCICCLEVHINQIQVFGRHSIDHGFRTALQLGRFLLVILYQVN